MKKKILIVLAAVFLAIAAGFGIYVSDYYHASEYVTESLPGTGNVQIEEIRNGLFLDGPGEENALIFYPGGKVEYTAYIPLLSALAEEGTDCFLLKMPCNLAILGINRASAVMTDSSYTYAHWYIGGHSLGGVAASSYAADHDLDGLILLASYPTKELDERTLELYGSEDLVLNAEKRAEGDAYLPEGSVVQVIEGGNHAQFGDYGEQEGDGSAAISREEQQKRTVEAILEMAGGK